MEIKWVEDFLSLTETRSFSRSADERCVTQPAFSRRIKSLEHWLGADLFDRSTYPVSLTLSGHAFLETARELAGKAHHARDLFRAQRRPPDNTLRFDVVHSLSLIFLPRWLKRLEEHFGANFARVSGTNIHDGAAALVEGHCDLFLCYWHPSVPILLDPERYPYHALAADRVVPVARAEPGGAPRWRLPGSAEAPVPLLGYTPHSFLGRVLERLLQSPPEAHFLREYYETDRPETAKAMALEGHGVGWLPERFVAPELAAGTLASAGDEGWTTPVEVRVYRARGNRGGELNRLWDYLVREFPPAGVWETGRAAAA